MIILKKSYLQYLLHEIVLTIAMIIGVTMLMTAAFEVISVRKDTTTAISSAIADIGRGANTVNTSPRYLDRPDTCNIVDIAAIDAMLV